jgi:uncharacterized protein (TIGR00255 family)
MIHSMTAFARREEETPWGVLIWELRTVNHRYLEMSPRLPEDFRVLESQVRERVSAVLQRGKVECQLRFQSFAPQSSDFALNKELIGRLVTATAEVDRMLDQPAAVNALEILRWPGVIQAPQPDHEQMAATALRVLEESLTELTANRAREGMKLKELILARCDGVAEQAAAAAQRLPEVRARRISRASWIRCAWSRRWCCLPNASTWKRNWTGLLPILPRCGAYWTKAVPRGGVWIS